MLYIHLEVLDFFGALYGNANHVFMLDFILWLCCCFHVCEGQL